MEIKIDSKQNEYYFILENNDSRDFIKLQIGTSKANELHLSVDLDELISAVNAFEHERVLEVTRKNNYQ